MKRSLILLKEQFYLSPGKEGNGFFSRGGGGHMVFKGNEVGKGGSVVANRVQRRLQSTFIAWEGWDRGFLGGHVVFWGIKGRTSRLQ